MSLSLDRNCYFVFSPIFVGKVLKDHPGSSLDEICFGEYSGQKGSNSEYYAAQMIRPWKIGKQYPKEFEEKREVEKTISIWRKMKTRNEFFSEVYDLIDQSLDKLQRRCHKANIYLTDKKLVKDAILFGKILKIFTDIIQVEKQFPKNHKISSRHELLEVCLEECELILNEFEDSDYDSFVDFANFEHVEKEIQADFWLLDSLKINESEITNALNFESLVLQESEALHLTSLHSEHARYKLLALKMIYEKYGFAKSVWHPTDSIKILAQQILENGPHIIKGAFSKQHFIKDPKKVFDSKLTEEVCGRSLYVWNRENCINTYFPQEPHAIVIVGVRKFGDEEVVLYVDPEDGSNPNFESSQNIYILTYEELKKRIVSIQGYRFASVLNTCFFLKKRVGDNEYAYYAPKLN
jgi:hypothetical protein